MRPNRERTLHDGAYFFPTDGNLCSITRKPGPCQSVREQFVKNISQGVLKHHFIRLGLTRAKAFQTARRFPRETRRCFAVPKTNAFTLYTYVMVPRDAFLPSKKAKTCAFMGRKRWGTARFCKEINNHIDRLPDTHLRFPSDMKFSV